MSHPPAASSSQRGFSLIELIVAFALMALVLTTALAVAARAYRQIGWSGSAAEASQWAQSLSDDAAGRPLSLGHTNGTVSDGRYQWSRDVSEYRDPEGLLLDAEGKPLLWRTVLEVQWSDGGQAHAITLLGLRSAPRSSNTGPAP